MSAAFRHKLSLKNGDVIVTIAPDDGRYTEAYFASRREMVRFAWSILADYEPDEAVAAAGGRDPKALGKPERGTMATGRGGVRLIKTPRLEHGSPGHAILLALTRGPPEGMRSRDLAQLANLPATPTAQVISNDLDRNGFVERMNEGRQGTPAIWAITPQGREEAERLGPYPQAVQAA